MSHILYAALFGALIGSFLNVIIYRLPRIMAGDKLTLSWPGSHCPHCKTKIRIYHNIPLISWLCLKGQCYQCQQPVHWRYPLVELLTAIMFALVIAKHGITLQSLSDLLLLCFLIPLFFIDLETQLLPNKLTYPLLLCALMLAGSRSGHVDFTHSCFAASLGFGLPWLLNLFYQWRHGRAGMGMGDMKLFAGVGAWLGYEALLHIMLLASLLAITTTLLFLRQKRHEAFPFGPYLIGATWVVFLSL